MPDIKKSIRKLGSIGVIVVSVIIITMAAFGAVQNIDYLMWLGTALYFSLIAVYIWTHIPDKPSN
jgi:hypothetical protein